MNVNDVDTSIISKRSIIKLTKSEAATETVFQIFFLFFLQEQPIYNFAGGSICSSNRHELSRMDYRADMSFLNKGLICSSNRPYYLIKHYTNFPKKPLFSPRTHTNFPGASTFSSNRYQLSREPHFLIEHIFLSRRPMP